MAHIANIRDDQGQIQTDPIQINARFAQCYLDLYTSRAGYTLDSLQDFLAQVVSYSIGG